MLVLGGFVKSGWMGLRSKWVIVLFVPSLIKGYHHWIWNEQLKLIS